MPAINITSVTPDTDAEFVVGQAGEAISLGKAVCFNKTDGKYYLADADNTNRRDVVGISVVTAGLNSQVVVQTGGQMTINGGATAGTIYVAGATPGDVNPAADLAAGWMTCIIAVGVNATKLKVLPIKTGATV